MKFDDALSNGPVMQRKCTDVLFCIFFIVFILGMGVVYAFSFKYGQPSLIVQSWDYDQNGCGLNDTTLNYPALYWPAIPDMSALEQLKTTGNIDGILKFLN